MSLLSLSLSAHFQIQVTSLIPLLITVYSSLLSNLSDIHLDTATLQSLAFIGGILFINFGSISLLAMSVCCILRG